MGKMIAEFGGRYLEWSSVVDAPVTYLMTEEELKEHLLQTYGYEEGLNRLEERLARVRKQGTSSQIGDTKKDLLRNNRAGDKEKCVKTEEEMVERYGTPSDDEQADPIDLEQPMELVDSFGYLGVHAPVLEVLSVVEDCVLSRVKLAELENPVIVLFDKANGDVLSKNFLKNFEVRNVKAAEA
jgi:hypothetical protein